jgi:hypothetical protein
MGKTFNVTLERLVAGPDSDLVKLRTQTVTGVTLELPCPGVSFGMIAQALDPAMSARLVSTSPVKSVVFNNKPNGDGFQYDTADFRTASGSEYRLTIHSANDLEVVGAPETSPEARA